MNKSFISKSYALTVIFSLLLSVSIASQGYAEVNPGFNRYIGIPMTPEEQVAKEKSQPLTATAVETSVVATAALPASETEITPEIQELARALKNDPLLIYEYVRNNIDYVPIFGSINGATGTLMAGRGSDYDQVSLFLALMKASGYTDYLYYYTSVTYPADKVANWIGVEQKARPICWVFGSGGIGLNIDGLSCNGIDPEYVPSNVTVMHVYARVTINSVYYYFDPSFKEYTYTAGINLSSAMGYDQSSFLNSALQGSTSTSDYIQNLNEGNIRNSLNTYSNNLAAYLKANKPNAYTKEIIGGRETISQSFQSLDPFKTFPYPKTVYSSTSYVRPEHRHKLNINHQGINKTFYTYEIYGKRISIFHTGASNAPELKVDGELITTGNACTQGNKYDATLSVDAPNGPDNSGVFKLTCGYSYAIAHDFEGISAGLIKKRNNELKKQRLAGLSDTSEPVLGEGLYLMGLNWIYEKKIEQDLAAQISDIVYIEHHIVGIVAQEAGYYIDVKVDTLSATSKNNNDAKETAWFFGMGSMGSSFEHGVIEQFQSNASASTMKILQIANSEGQKIFNATSANWDAISGQLQNYTSNQISELQTLINDGYTITLPQNANTQLNQWRGLGYIAKKIDGTGIFAQYTISGNFYGGFGSTPANLYVPQIDYQTWNYLTAIDDIEFLSSVNLTTPSYTSLEPVSMVTGDYLFDNSDLSLGISEPNGLNFARSYTSSASLEKGSMGFGWKHGYEITLEKHSDGPNAFGKRSPVDTASAIAGLYAILDILYNNTNNDRMMISALSSKWLVDSVTDNAVTVKRGNKSLEFIQLADGSFNPPPGITSELVKNADIPTH